MTPSPARPRSAPVLTGGASDIGRIEASDDAAAFAHDLDALAVLQVQRAIRDDFLAGLDAVLQRDGFRRDEGDAHRATLRAIAFDDEDTRAILVSFDDRRDRHVDEL